MREANNVVRDALNAAWAIVLLLWPLSAIAAAGSLGEALGDVTLKDWVSLVVLTTVSGLVALLQRIRASVEASAHAAAGREAREADRIVIDWRLFALAHMAGAVFVGGVAFLLMSATGSNAHFSAAVIALASWSGAKLADKWADTVGDRLSGVITGGGNRS